MGFCFNELGKVGEHLNGTSGKAGGGQKAGNPGEGGQGTGAKQGHVAGHAAPVKRKVGPLNIGPASGSITRGLSNQTFQRCDTDDVGGG